MPTEDRSSSSTTTSRRGPDGVLRTKPPQKPAPAPAAEVQLTDQERAALEAEKQMLIEHARRGAFYPISEPAPAPAPEPVTAPKRVPDVVVTLLKDATNAAARQEAEYIKAQREALAGLVTEAKKLLARYQELRDEAYPELASLAPGRIDWPLVAAACRRHGVFEGVPGAESLRNQIVELMDALSTNTSSSGDLAKVPARVAQLDMTELRSTTVKELQQTVSQHRAGIGSNLDGPASLRAKWVQIQRRVRELGEALDGKEIPLPVLRTKGEPWNGSPFANKKPSNRTITSFDVLSNDPLANG